MMWLMWDTLITRSVCVCVGIFYVTPKIMSYETESENDILFMQMEQKQGENNEQSHAKLNGSAGVCLWLYANVVWNKT